MTVLIGPWLIGPWSSPSDRVVAAEVVDQKQGRRALLRYRLAGPAGDRAETLLGKLYADAGRSRAGARPHDPPRPRRVRRLARSRRPAGVGLERRSAARRVPTRARRRLRRPIGFGDGDEGIQREAVGDRRLAGWPASTVPGWSSIVASTSITRWPTRRSGRPRSPGPCPRWAARPRPRSASLRSATTGLRVRTDVPIHKDFHHQHLVLAAGPPVGGRPGRGPARRSRRWTWPTSWSTSSCAPSDPVHRRTGRRLARTFVDAYRAETGWAADERFAFFGRYTAVKIAKQLAVGSGLRPRPAGPEAERQARLVLERLGGARS